MEFRILGTVEATADGAPVDLGSRKQRLVLAVLRPRFVGQLMLALHREGRTDIALTAYRDLRTRLAAALGLDPAPELFLTHDRQACAPPCRGRDCRDGSAPRRPRPAALAR
ncbi:BTAD domain-containing putative transcriptional regulator [Amycolatopsis sp. NPDC051061]|uniref:BTAD domain-containing putative transcriptional regulator n=1 Tax=Amycolatopsis sp. NPDC051061 TaxID=3155042 RepID=UPI0034269354